MIKQQDKHAVATSEKLPYRIYLLTVWQEHSQEEIPDHGWRFHLTDPQTGKRYGFTSLATLLVALQQATSHDSPDEEVS
jgi:hypothetical protein